VQAIVETRGARQNTSPAFSRAPRSRWLHPRALAMVEGRDR